MTKDLSLKALAPSVAADWREGFVGELRLQGVGGAAIVDALVEAESHCRESGHGAADIFGDAATYARALGLPKESLWTAGDLIRTWVALLLVVGGVTMTLMGGIALALGREAEVTVGWLVSGAVSVVAMVLVFIMGERILRVVLERPVLSAVGFGAVVTGTVIVGLPFRDVVLGTVPAALALGVGVAALLAWFVLIRLWRRAGKGLDDPLVAPVIQGSTPSHKEAEGQ